MTEQEFEQFADRVGRVERENLRLRRILRRTVGGLVAVVLVVVAGGAALLLDVTRVQQMLAVVDGAGQDRATLGVNGAGRVGFSLLDPAGNPRLCTFTTASHDVRLLFQDKTNARIDIGIDENGVARLLIRDRAGQVVHNISAP